MKLTPMGHVPQQPPTPTSNNSSARDRAVAAYSTGQLSPEALAKHPEHRQPQPAPQAQETPVANPNQVSPEELSAIQPAEGQKLNIEVQEETETEVAEAPAPVSSQMAILARKEKALRAQRQQQEQALKAREDALKAKEAELEAKYSKNQFDPSEYVPKSRLKEQTLEVLAEEGLSYDELTQQLINQQPRNPRYEALLSKQTEQIQKLQALLEGQQKAQVEQQDQAYKAALRQIETDVVKAVKTNPDFELIRATKSQKDVVDLIERTFKEEGYVMSVEEASQEVEDYLVGEAEKLSKIEKIRRRLAPAPAAPAKTESQPPATPKQPQPMKTLTNANSGTRKLSARERAIERAKGYRGEF